MARLNPRTQPGSSSLIVLLEKLGNPALVYGLPAFLVVHNSIGSDLDYRSILKSHLVLRLTRTMP